jgi:chaperonin GroES
VSSGEGGHGRPRSSGACRYAGAESSPPDRKERCGDDSACALRPRAGSPHRGVRRQCKGEIIIPDTAKEKPQEGKVIAVGDGKILENGTKVPLDVKAGDKILFGKYSGTDIKIDGEEVLILREDEVLAVLA